MDKFFAMLLRFALFYPLPFFLVIIVIGFIT